MEKEYTHIQMVINTLEIGKKMFLMAKENIFFLWEKDMKVNYKTDVNMDLENIVI